MANIEHKNIPDANLHQPKGIATASAGALIVADGAGSSAVTSTSNTPVNLYDNTISRSLLKDTGEVVNAIGNVGAITQDIDLTSGNIVTATLTDNPTFTFSNPSPTGNMCKFKLILTQDGTGSRTVTWPVSVDWPSATAPTLTTTGNAVDILEFYTIDAGTTWYGITIGLDFS